MNVAEAKAILREAEATEALVAAKEAYRADPTPKNKKAKKAAEAEVVAARDDWRNNFRQAPSEPGDAAVTPEPVRAGGKVTPVGG